MIYFYICCFKKIPINKNNYFSDICRFANSFGSMTRLRVEFERLKSLLIKTESPIVFAHNDLLLGNVIHDESKGKISFIDYEYASYNYQAFDIANHFNEFVGKYYFISNMLTIIIPFLLCSYRRALTEIVILFC